MKGYKNVSKLNEARLNNALAVLEAKRNCIRSGLCSYYKLKRSMEMSVNNIENAGFTYDLYAKNIERIFNDNMNSLNQCFDYFEFDGPLVILYGYQGDVNFRRCEFGNSNAYHCALNNHIDSLSGIVDSLPYYLVEMKEEVKSYIEQLKEYYELVLMVA